MQSGFGRTGKWAAYQHFDVIPDISTWAKSMGSGMPIGAVIGKAAIMDACKPSTIGGTYPGNPVCCAAAIATLEYMEEININALGEKVGKIVRERFMAMKKKFPAIGDVRGLGAMMAFELVKNNDPFQPDAELCKKLISYCADHGLIVINAGLQGNIIRVLSPLVIEEDLLKKGLDILEAGLERSDKINIMNKLFINGEWMGALDGSEYDLINPSTEELISTVAYAGKADTVCWPSMLLRSI